MSDGLVVKEGVVIPLHEIDIATSRSGGPGGQHVNKTDSRVTARWNVYRTVALNDEQKELVLSKLQSQLTTDGDLIVHMGESRSQPQNKHAALERLAQIVRKALHVPKKRMATRMPKAAKEARLESKARHSKIKKMRSRHYED